MKGVDKENLWCYTIVNKGQRKSKSKKYVKGLIIKMKMSDIIEQFLLEMLSDESDVTVKRNELASQFSCAPSQINYVIDTRFTGQRGYIVESRRGGGGFIRIRRADVTGSGGYIMHVVNSIGEYISFDSVHAMLANMLRADIITKRELLLMESVLNDRAIPFNRPQSDQYRAQVFKNMLMSLVG